MRVVQGYTGKGSLTNCIFVEEDNNAYCFSYGQQVAAIINGCYTEYTGYMYYSRTSVRHKNIFKKQYNYLIKEYKLN